MIDRLEVIPGTGTVIRRGELAAWAGPAASPALISFIDQSARNLVGSAKSGHQVVEHLAGILATDDPEPGVAFVVVGPDGEGWVALLHGPVQVWDGLRWVSPAAEPGWLRRSLDPQPSITVGTAGEAAPNASLDSVSDLESGVVPGGGFVLTPQRQVSVKRPTGQTVTATLCGRGHPNRPGMVRCARCGEPVLASRIARVDQPPLGCLVLDDGSVFRLDGGYTFGSDPRPDTESVPLLLEGSEVSATHAGITVEGWDVLASDLGSASGTFVYRQGQQSWVRLPPFESCVVEPGTHVAAGGRVITYVSPYVVQEPDTRSR